MSDQEIIDAIDAEIGKTEYASRSHPESFAQCMQRINGLRFARALIVKRMEGGK